VVAPQGPAHVQPVDAGHHHVEDQQVGPTPPDELGLLGVVLGDQHVSTHSGPPGQAAIVPDEPAW